MTWTTQPRSKFGQLNAIVSGIGQQIVFIHGVGLRAEAWSEQTSELSKLYKTVAIDIPGHGECSIPTDD
ncbi:MAG: alpha/beta hydrolase, partial [Rhodobacterales bacterium]|nr:alpha/beta hydrolase [Rhodobacterales bacterium]